MNVTFRLPSEALEARFVSEAQKAGLSGLKGHRSVGGCRASIYNAVGMDAVKALADFMVGVLKRKAGIRVGGRFTTLRRTRIVEVLASKEIGGRFTVMGWVRTRRDSKGGFSFIELNDGSCLRGLQVIADQTLPNYEEDVLRLQTGCAVRAEGSLAPSPGKGQSVELKAEEIRVLGWADPEDYPLQKKRHSFEFLRTIAHLRPRTNTFGAVARVRNVLSRAIHAFFQERGFIYLHTPIISGSDCEGAGEMFRVTTLDLSRMPLKDGKVDFTQDFFGGPANLTVSGQLEAEIYALAMGDVYTFGPTFRAENSNTSRHLAEFWMVEPEMAFCDLEGDRDLAVEFLEISFHECPGPLPGRPGVLQPVYRFFRDRDP